MKDTVAIIGSAETKSSYDFERQDSDIWVFNEAMHAKWCKRADAVFQMHDPLIWRSSMNRNDPKHYEWLKSGDTPTIYMTAVYDDVPKSVAYPLEDIKATFPRAYFTSSISYAIALAIYQGYKNIEIYGVEMATNTEYWHQREGVAYWIGVAEGRGLKVDFHSRSMLFSPLYGYEGNLSIPVEFFHERLKVLEKPYTDLKNTYEENKKIMHDKLDEFQANFKTDMTKFDDAIYKVGQAGHNFSVIDGSQQIDNIFLKKIEKMKEESGAYFIGRQEYDDIIRNGHAEGQKAMPKIVTEGKLLEGVLKELKIASNKDRRRQLAKEFIEQFGKYIKAVNVNGVLQGSILECGTLMQKHDQVVRMAGGAKAEEVMMGDLSANLTV